MGLELVHKFTGYLERVTWPTKEESTPLGVQTFEMGLDQANEFDGKNPNVLQEGVKRFLSGDSLPFAYAGVAYVLLMAAVEQDGSYTSEAIDTAVSWLEKAQAIEEDLTEINFIEGLVYLRRGEIENCRLVLDYLFEQSPYYYHLHITEALYWHALDELDEMENSYTKAAESADNVPKRLRLYTQMAQAYQGADQLDKALGYYKKALYFNKESGKLWHQISVIYWKQGELNECLRANKKTLSLTPTAGAKKLRQALQKRIEAEKKRR